MKLAKEFEDLPRIRRPTSDKFLVLIDFFNFVFEKENTAFCVSIIFISHPIHRFLPRRLFD